MGKLRPATAEEIAEYEASQAGPRLREATPEEAAEYQASQPKPAKREETSQGEAALLGAGDYASMGFGDELTGVASGIMHSPIGRWLREKTGVMAPYEGEEVPKSFGEAYKTGRDASRGLAEKAADEHPLTYHGAGIAATVLNPLGRAKTGAKFAERAGRAAGLGATAGLGTSKADLGEGEFLEAAKDTAIGAGLGVAGETVATGVAKGAKAVGNKVVGGLKKRIVNEAAQGTTPTAGKHIANAGDPISDLVIADPRVQKAATAGSAEEGRALLKPVFAETKATRDAAYGALREAGADAVDLDAYRGLLAAKRAQLVEEGDAVVIEALDRFGDAVDEFAVKEGGGKLTIEQLRKLTTQAQQRAAGTIDSLQPRLGAQALGKVQAVATEAMDDTLSTAVAGKPGLEEVAEAIRANNKKYQAAKTIDSALEQRAFKESRKVGIGERLGQTAASSLSGGVLGAVTAGKDEDSLARGAMFAAGAAAIPWAGRRYDRAVTKAGIAAARAKATGRASSAAAPLLTRLGRAVRGEEERNR